MFGSFYLSFFLSFCLLDYVALSWHLNTYEWPVSKRETSFQTKQFICTATLFLSPSKMFRSFYLSFSLSVYVTLWLYLNNFERPIPKRESSFQTEQFFFTPTLWCWERLGRPILSPLQNVSIFLFIFQSFGLCYSFILHVSEHLWMNYSKEMMKFSNQSVH